MYDTLHSERLESPNYHGVTFIAQIIGGKINFGAKLTMPLRKQKNEFEIWQYEWSRDNGPYILNVNEIYSEVFQYDDVQTWVADTVIPWADRTKRAFLGKQHEHTLEVLAKMEKELDRLSNPV